jgi:phytoene synthase
MIADDYRHCEALVREADKDRFLSALFAPAKRRDALFALYAFNIEIARIPALAREPFAAAIRLQWWCEALLGERDGEAAAHPVASALRDALKVSHVDPAPLIEHIDAERAQAFGEPETISDAAIFLTAAQLLGGSDDVAQAAASAGRAYALSTSGQSPEIACDQYREFRNQLGEIPKLALPAFLPVALVPLLLKYPHAAQWRRQFALLRAAWFGFAKI